MNFFSTRDSAGRYAVGRPDFHSNTINRISEFLNIKVKLDKVLDIACGTGLSSKALLPIANNVYGTDVSQEMLNVALEKDKINYGVATAEQQPFGNDEFDLITVSSGVHWFNVDAFLVEANRLLKPKGWLVIYENFFSGDMPDNTEFKVWVSEVYLQKFPSPPRNKNYDWTTNNLEPKNFSIYVPENFNNAVSFNKQQLINYFTTQSNVIAAVNINNYNYIDVEKWLDNQLSAFFENDKIIKTINYGNWIKHLQKM